MGRLRTVSLGFLFTPWISFPSFAQQAVPIVAAPSLLQGLASLVSAILWPTILIIVLLRHGRDVLKMFGRLKSFEMVGVRADLHPELKAEMDDAARHADVEARGGPTPEEVDRATKVDRKLANAPRDSVLQEGKRLAVEYGDVRVNQRPGDKRTVAMERIVARMRALGIALFAWRYELSVSPTPGERLLAIVILQLRTDFDLVPWLAERTLEQGERAFVAYHATLALLRAVEQPFAADHIDRLEAAVKHLSQGSFKDEEIAANVRSFIAKVAAIEKRTARSSRAGAQSETAS